MTEEQMQGMKKIIMDCAVTEKAAQSDVEDFFAHKPAVKKEAKCHRACIHEAFGTVSCSEYKYKAVEGCAKQHIRFRFYDRFMKSSPFFSNLY